MDGGPPVKQMEARIVQGSYSAAGELAYIIFAPGYNGLLGGGSGGFTAASQPVVDLLRQRSRPYLFSNTLTPALAAAGIKSLELLDSTGELRERLRGLRR